MLSRIPIANLSDSSATTSFEDSIAQICWYPDERFHVFGVSSWDSKVRIYSVTEENSVQILQERSTFNTEYPCLSLSFRESSNHMAAGFIDGTVSVIDTSRGEQTFQTIGKHEDAVKGVYFFQESDGNSFLCSVSYDKTLKVWDLRQQGPVATIRLGAKVVCSDMAFPKMILGLSNQRFHVFNILQDLIQHKSVGPERDTTLGADSPLSSVSIAKDGAIGIGSLSGRSALSWLDGLLSMKDTFCFRAQQITAGQAGNTSGKAILFPVNAVGIHPKNTKTYFTTGRDGVINIWDTKNRKRIKRIETGGIPVTEAKWSPDGNMLAYGCGYDWSTGIGGAKSFKTTLRIHKVQPSELAN